MTARTLDRTLIYGSAVLLALWVIVPFYLIFLSAFSRPNDVFVYPKPLLPTDLSTETMQTFLQSTGVTANVLLPGGATATRMVAHVAEPKALLQPEIMAAPIAWLASDESNDVTGRRFIAAKWNAALSPAQAAQAASAPAAWTGYGDKSIKPA